MSVISKRLIGVSRGNVVSNAWDLNFATRNFGDYGALYVYNEEPTPQGIHFKPDGTKFYIIGGGTDKIYEYNATTSWAINSASYFQEVSVQAQEANPRGLVFKPDGTKLYIIGINIDSVMEYSLSTAWDISTIAYVDSFSVSLQEANPEGLYISNDGTNLYITGYSSDSVHQYSLSTAWDITSASFVRTFSVSLQEANPRGLFFKSDGTKMYLIGSSGDDVNEYTLSTAWDISTCTYSTRFIVGREEASPQDVFFSSDGTNMYIVGSTSRSAYRYLLSTPWDVDSAAWLAPDQNYLYIFSQEAAPSDIFFKPDGTKMYICGTSGREINEYDLSTPWQILDATFVRARSFSAQDTQPHSIYFTDDGETLYMLGSENERVYRYELTIPWDISTINYLNFFSISVQDLTSTCLSFKSDGTKMYVGGTSSQAIHEYDLSTAWDITSASHLQSFSISNPQGMFFKPDGTRLYVVTTSGDKIVYYDLSTAWNISTAYLVGEFIVLQEEINPSGLFFSNDGKKLFITGNTSDAVWAYNI